MFKSLKNSLIILCAITGSSAYAGDIEKCENLSSQTALNSCSANALKASDQKINSVYSNFMKALNSKEKIQLRDAQRSWIQYKEKDCQFQSSPVEKGSLYPFVHNSCLVEKTEIRIKELQDMQKCRSGNEPDCL